MYDDTEFTQKLENLFSYHPPQNDAEQELHAVVNQASVEYAKTLSSVVKNPAELTTILREIQKVRMLANSAVCYERVGVSYRDLFSSGNDKA